MGLTPSGLPWPEPSAPVQQGAAAIRALAEAIDPRASYKAMVVGGNYTTDAQGYFVINVPSGAVNGFMVDYFGTFQPILINPYNAGGTGVGFKVWSMGGTGAPAPIANSVVPVTGVIYYA
jgi:hypothetical protein